MSQTRVHVPPGQIHMCVLLLYLLLHLLCACLLCSPQEEQEELAAVEAEARQELRAAQQALAEAQEALAVTSDKVCVAVGRSDVSGLFRPGGGLDWLAGEEADRHRSRGPSPLVVGARLGFVKSAV